MDVKMASGAHVILTARDPKDRNMPFVCISNKSARDYPYCLGLGDVSLSLNQ